MSSRLAVFAYDIRDDKVRRHALKTLREWRLDGQLSVHECQVDAIQARRLFEQLGDELDPATDAWLFTWVEGHRAVLARGKGRTTALQDGLLLAA